MAVFFVLLSNCPFSAFFLRRLWLAGFVSKIKTRIGGLVHSLVIVLRVSISFRRQGSRSSIAQAPAPRELYKNFYPALSVIPSINMFCVASLFHSFINLAI